MLQFDGFSLGLLQNRVPLMKAMCVVMLLVAAELSCVLIRWSDVFGKAGWLRAFYYASLLWLIALLGTFSGNRFIYFQF
ncbi:MAG: hypothetical protein R3C05_07605 [Pirellulaceae bacterium]